jgi:hypothetical protein
MFPRIWVIASVRNYFMPHCLLSHHSILVFVPSLFAFIFDVSLFTNIKVVSITCNQIIGLNDKKLLCDTVTRDVRAHE